MRPFLSLICSSLGSIILLTSCCTFSATAQEFEQVPRGDIIIDDMDGEEFFDPLPLQNTFLTRRYGIVPTEDEVAGQELEAGEGITQTFQFVQYWRQNRPRPFWGGVGFWGPGFGGPGFYGGWGGGPWFGGPWGWGGAWGGGAWAYRPINYGSAPYWNGFYGPRFVGVGPRFIRSTNFGGPVFIARPRYFVAPRIAYRSWGGCYYW